MYSVGVRCFGPIASHISHYHLVCIRVEPALLWSEPLLLRHVHKSVHRISQSAWEVTSGRGHHSCSEEEAVFGCPYCFIEEVCPKIGHRSLIHMRACVAPMLDVVDCSTALLACNVEIVPHACKAEPGDNAVVENSNHCVRQS